MNSANEARLINIWNYVHIQIFANKHEHEKEKYHISVSDRNSKQFTFVFETLEGELTIFHSHHVVKHEQSKTTGIEQ